VARLRETLAREAATEIPLGWGSNRPWDYPDDPIGYAENILGVRTLTEPQKDILRHLRIPPYKVLVPSGHDVGKTFALAVAVNWWFDSFDPGVVISTAPTERDTKQLLWTEVRLQRQRAGLSMPFIGPSAPEMRTGPEHWAVGYTARKGESFQGRHRPRMFFAFDEANAIEPIFWESTRSMFDPALGHSWMAIYNPTSTTTQAYIEANSTDAAGNPRWHLFRLSAADHPNLQAELEGRPRPVPHAVSLAMFEEWLKEWCEPVQPGDERMTDFAWPPVEWCRRNGRTPKLYRPGPIFQGRALGLDPDTGDGVWSPALFEACLKGPCPPYPVSVLPRLGIDCSTGKGEDFVGFHGRWGAVSVLADTSNTMDAVRIFGHAKEHCQALADLVNQHRPRGSELVKATQVPVTLDDDGTGSSVGAFLARDGYTVHLVGAGTKAARDDLYPRRRDELWFAAAEKARKGGVYLGRLEQEPLRRLRQQLLAVAWDMDAKGRRQVEKKDVTKKKIGRSPDDADAFLLAHHEPPSGGAEVHSGGGRGDWRPGNLAQPEPPRQVAYEAAEGPREDYRRKPGGHFGYR
jgi:hypothetical protein